MAKSDMEKAAKSRAMKYIEVEVGGEKYEFRAPTTAQFLIYAGAFSEAQDDALRLMPALQKFLRRTSVDEAQFEEIWERLEDGQIDLDELILNDDSVLMLMGEEMGGRPTGPSEESSSDSSPTTGKRSTGRSPGKGSTRSS